MATTDLGGWYANAADASRAATAGRAKLGALLAPLASLRLTVALFGLSLVLVFVGTLAQRTYDINYVVDRCFRSWTSPVELRWFLTGDAAARSPSPALPFVGGKLLGAALAINLLAAHALRFQAVARGRRLAMGSLLVAAGMAITWGVIRSGLGERIESEFSPRFADGLWNALRATTAGLALTMAYGLTLSYRRLAQGSQRWAWRLGAAGTAVTAVLAAALLVNPELRLDDSGLRILWQLVKATGASAVLWLGCRLVFGKRDGVVLLHGGVALLMFSELYTGEFAVESRVRFVEGETVAFAEDIRYCELALIDKSDAKVDKTVQAPAELLERAKGANRLRSDLMPIELRVVDYFPNAEVRLRQPGESSPANAGLGKLRIADSTPVSTGVDAEQRVDVPAAYVEAFGGSEGESLGVFLLSPALSPETLSIGGQPFELALRFRRVHKPYELTLVDFTKEDYVGTDTPKNFESVVRLQDPDRNVDSTQRIWMNNPLRYAGDTLYQSSFDPQRPDYSELQVVTNQGWMAPYVACMIVATGMSVHFGAAIWRFVRRREEESQRAAKATGGGAGAAVGSPSLLRDWRVAAVWGPALVAAICGAYVARKAAPPHDKPNDAQLLEFGQLPAAYGGRTQPLDTLARNTLRLISGQQTFEDAMGVRQPAIRWFLDAVSQAPAWRDHRAFRIENLEVLQALGLEPRKGFRYSFNELGKNAVEYDKQVRLAQQVQAEGKSPLTLVQHKWLELAEKVQRTLVLLDAFGTPDFSGGSPEELQASLRRVDQRIAALNRMAPRPIVPADPQGAWKTTMEAERDALLELVRSGGKNNVDDGVRLFRKMLVDYGQGDVPSFNASLAEYRKLVDERARAEAAHESELAATGAKGSRKPAERLALDRLAFEAYYNHFSPFTLCMALYVIVFVLAAAGWLGWFEGFNRAANWVLWLAFGLHTLALVCRVIISGRPPVTSLYSSAVFIGWGVVFFALIFEMIYRLGIGNLLAGAVGYPTLLIAYYLTFEANGDTFGVMQAVLDTNFWLGTHVVCISLGYTTTFLAGALGIVWIVMGQMLGKLSDVQSRQVARMTYGAVCFAILFSFIGTVLGGLWADDSWGRFWGWDPKENGALMIVLWNAIVLHARWGKMIGPRGLAVLSVFGNVVTAWSWFGVNQLGIGLHAYGFTDGVTKALVAFAASQVLLMVASLAVPPRSESAATA